MPPLTSNGKERNEVEADHPVRANQVILDIVMAPLADLCLGGSVIFAAVFSDPDQH
jgi:hypothetical protein